MTEPEINALAAECQRIAQALAAVPGLTVEDVQCDPADWPEAHVAYRVNDRAYLVTIKDMTAGRTPPSAEGAHYT